MVNVFSFCLYGPENPRYYPGILENIALAGKHFPDWKVYVYYAPDVTTKMISTLEPCSSVVLRPTGVHGSINMIHRFYAIDEEGVDTMMVRDADSRIHWKDRWAIRSFLSSGYGVHTIRDHFEHTSKMMGGLWGIRKSAGIHMQTEYAEYNRDPNDRGVLGHDQDFLNNKIYPKIRNNLLVHYSNKRAIGSEVGIEFPFQWSDLVYCGRIEYNYVDTPQPQPTQNRLALPTPFVRIRDSPPSLNFLNKK